MIYNCLECGSPLKKSGYTVGEWLWCGNGQCKSRASNYGAYGTNEAEAYSALVIRIEQEWDKEEDE